MYRILPALLTSLILFSACTPKDQKITRADNRVSQNALPGGQVDGRSDDYKHLLVLLDRSTEALNLFKVLTDKQYAEQNAYKVEDKQLGSEEFKKITHQSKKENESFILNSDINFLAKIELSESSELKKISITNNPAIASSDISTVDTITSKSKAGLNLVVKNTLKQITFLKTENQNEFEVEVVTYDEVNSATTGKSLIASHLTFNMKNLDPATAESFEVTKVSLSQNRYGVQAADFSMQSDDTSLVTVKLNVNNQCSSLTGDLKLLSIMLNRDSKPLYTREVKYVDSSVLMKSGKNSYDLKADECSNRALVDLTKIF